jgi:hypothetical protein
VRRDHDGDPERRVLIMTRIAVGIRMLVTRAVGGQRLAVGGSALLVTPSAAANWRCS